MPFDPRPITLEGNSIRLEPLSTSHAADLLAAGRDPGIWTYLPRAPVQHVADVQDWIGASLAASENGLQVPFAIIHKASGRAAGSTRFMDISRPNRNLEIGWTWIAPEFQRSAVNTECKYLLLRHAFEELNAVRVQLKTDARNIQSQRAIERIGAVREGVLRKHIVLWDGYIRDTVYFSIIESEWAAVKTRLESRMTAP